MVLFDFHTKDEWINFSKKLLSDKDFKKYVMLFELVKKKYGTVEDYIEYCCSKDNFVSVAVAHCMTTRSIKTLNKLNDWLKDNHYESNYELRDNWGNELGMGLDELLNTQNDLRK